MRIKSDILKEKKVLFVLHSSIAELMLLQLLDKRLLRKESVRVVTVRNYQLTVELLKSLPVIKLNDIWPLNPFISQRFMKFWKIIGIRKRCISKIEKFMEEDFLFFAPYMSLVPFYTLINSKKCKGVFIFEEGIGSYGDISKFETFRVRGNAKGLKRILHFLNYGKSVPAPRKFIDFYHSKLLGTFSFSSGCFPGKKNTVINWPDISTINKFISSEDFNLRNSNILIFDTFYIRLNFGLDVFFLSLNAFLKVIVDKKRPGIIYYKLHPEQVNDECFIGKLNFLFSQFENVSFVEISRSVSIEFLSVLSKNTYYVFYSSLAIYVTNNSANIAYSGHNFVKPIVDMEKTLASEVPKEFWDRVKNFDL